MLSDMAASKASAKPQKAEVSKAEVELTAQLKEWRDNA